ncbi:MAG: metallophosphoesterase family protein [Pseudomonadota bacterium]
MPMEPANPIINLNDLSQTNEIKIGVISDTHNYVNENIMDILKTCDAILHAGDIGNADVINTLSQCSPHVFSVRGNNDIEEKWPEEDLNELEKIPDNIELEFIDQKLAVTHGHQFYKVEVRHDKLRNQFPDADIIIYGHSHIIACDQEQKPWVINPGAGGKTRTKGGASCMILNYKNNAWKIEQYRDAC